MISTILFDLDETLYPPETGVMEAFRARMLQYMGTLLGLTPDEAEPLRRHYFQTYGTTMRGLQLNHHIDAEAFLHFVHDIPLQDYLQPNPALDAVLGAIVEDKVVFTNASREHAERVLSLLGIRPRFARIVDVRDVGYESKPQLAAYKRACELLGVRPDECLIVEDSVRNLLPAKALGMLTVLVHDGSSGVPQGIDYAIHRIEEIGSVVSSVEAKEACRPGRGAGAQS